MNVPLWNACIHGSCGTDLEDDKGASDRALWLKHYHTFIPILKFEPYIRSGIPVSALLSCLVIFFIVVLFEY